VRLRELARAYLENCDYVTDLAMDLEKAEEEGYCVDEVADAMKWVCFLKSMSEEELVRYLRELAKRYPGTCISCRHSRAFRPGEVSCLEVLVNPHVRACELGLAQGTCGRYEPFEEVCEE